MSSFRKLDAFVYDYITIMYEASTRRDCDLKVIGRSFVESSFSIALTKNSSLTSNISQTLRYYKEYNIQEELRKKWFRWVCRRNEETDVAQSSIQSMSGLFFAVIIGIVVATINVFLRHCICQFCNRKENNISCWKERINAKKSHHYNWLLISTKLFYNYFNFQTIYELFNIIEKT